MCKSITLSMGRALHAEAKNEDDYYVPASF
jgi:hypothetical protein